MWYIVFSRWATMHWTKDSRFRLKQLSNDFPYKFGPFSVTKGIFEILKPYLYIALIKLR